VMVGTALTVVTAVVVGTALTVVTALVIGTALTVATALTVGTAVVVATALVVGTRVVAAASAPGVTVPGALRVPPLATLTSHVVAAPAALPAVAGDWASTIAPVRTLGVVGVLVIAVAGPRPGFAMSRAVSRGA
jgi:hypothetical protein